MIHGAHSDLICFVVILLLKLLQSDILLFYQVFSMKCQVYSALLKALKELKTFLSIILALQLSQPVEAALASGRLLLYKLQRPSFTLCFLNECSLSPTSLALSI